MHKQHRSMSMHRYALTKTTFTIISEKLHCLQLKKQKKTQN